MKKHLPLLVISLLLFSCQKEFSVSAPTVPTPTSPPTTSDSILISKLIGLDTTKPSPFDTIYIAKIFYDNSKRMSADYMIEYNNTGAMVDTFSQNKYYYTGTDTLPYKSTSIIKDLSTISWDTDFTVYSSPPRKLLSDSGVERTNSLPPNRYGWMVTYNYTANTVTQTSTSYTNNVYQGTDSYVAYQTLNNGNVITQRDTLPSASYIENYNEMYDSKPTPFKNQVDGQILTYGDDFLISYGKNNNSTERNETSLDNSGNLSVLHYKYFYTYRSDNYPLESAILNVGSTSPRPINKIKYIYTN